MDGILGNVTIRDEQAHEAASMYYLQGQTMETIARHLGVSRSSVSRLLTYARNSGLVRISVAATPGNRGSLSGQINDLFKFCKGRFNIEIQIRIRELIAIASRIRTFINIFHRAVYTKSIYLQGMNFIQQTRIRILKRIPCVAIGVIRPH